MRMGCVLFPSPALLSALPLSLTLLSSVQRASPKYVITKGGGGKWNYPDFVFVPDGCKKLTFSICLWNWISEIARIRNNTSKVYVLECVCVYA